MFPEEVPTERLAIITVVGENMVRTPGVAAELFRRLSSINVVSISQGASELSISVAISESDLGRAIPLSHGIRSKKKIKSIFRYITVPDI